jgi:hypothetical protein
MPTAAIPIISSIVGAAGGALNKQKNTASGTQTQTQNATTTENTSTSGARSRQLLPEQQAALAQLMPYIQQLMTNPQGALQPLQQYARSASNANYAGAEEALRTKLGRTGAKSGKMGAAMRAMELSRIGQLSGVDSSFAQKAYDAQQTGANLGMNLLGMNFGETYDQAGTGTRKTEGTSTGTSQSTSTSSQDPWAGGLAGGLGGYLGGSVLQNYLKKP